MTSPSAEHVSGKCVQCDACSQVVIETVPGRGQGWKCPECGWWYWLQEPKKVTHAKAELDRLEVLEKEATKGPWSVGWDGIDGCWFIPEPFGNLTGNTHVSPHGSSVEQEADAALIAALRNAAPALIAVARAAERKSYRRPGMANSRGFEDLAAIDAALDRLDAEAPGDAA